MSSLFFMSVLSSSRLSGYICSRIRRFKFAGRNNPQEPRQRRGFRNHSCVNLGGQVQIETSIRVELSVEPRRDKSIRLLERVNEPAPLQDASFLGRWHCRPALRFRNRLVRDRVKPTQGAKSRKITIRGAQCKPMLDCQRGQMSVRHQIAVHAW